jgi:hypothetical protein
MIESAIEKSPSPRWFVRPTRIIGRRRKDLFQKILIYPPARFSGSFRFSVIDGYSRMEFSAGWRDGEQISLSPELRERLSPLFASRDTRSWPAAVETRIDPAKPAEPIKIDILFEDLAGATSADGAPPLSTISITPKIEAARIFMVPIMTNPPEDEAMANDLLGTALVAADRDESIRLAIPATWSTLLQASAIDDIAARLQADGRLDYPALEALPFEPETKLGTSPLTPELAPITISIFDQLLSQSASRNQRSALQPDTYEGQRQMSGPPQLVSFYPFHLPQPGAWDNLGGAIRNWNREYEVPKLVLATPRDMMAIMESLSGNPS